MSNPRDQLHDQQGQNADTDHKFLELGSGAFADRIHMGGMRLSTRINIYLLFSLAAFIVFAGMYVYVDQRVDKTLTTWRESQDIAELIGRIETGVAKINGQEKQFLLSKDVQAAVGFDQDINDVSKALDRLYRLPESIAIRQTIATLRDGLVQYDEQFIDVVKAERVLGIADTSGLSARLRETTRTLQIRFRQAGHANLSDQITRINNQGKETLSSGFRQGVDEIQKRYGTLHAFLEAAEIAPRAKSEMTELLKSHETDMLTLINRRFALDSETERFNDILAYVAPSLDRLALFSKEQTVSATRALEKIQAFARYTIAGGSAAILLWLIFVGLLLMRSMSNGIRTIAISAQRIATGERGVNVPGQGNVDAIGQAARALDRWTRDLNQMDLVRQELDQTRRKLQSVVAEADLQASAAVETAKAAFMADIEAEPRLEDIYEPAPELPPEPASQPNIELPELAPSYVPMVEQRPIPSPLKPNVGAGPISSVSQQLAHFSGYVTAAAEDVERTERLMVSLHEATGQLDSLGGLVTSVRDQTNLLAFHTTTREPRADAENLIPFNEEGRRHAEGPFPDQGLAQRFDAIRDVTERAERTVQAIRISMQNVTDMANDIAATASHQALDATNKLLAQSEYLQTMLDDIVHKIKPAPKTTLSDQDRPITNPYGNRSNKNALD